MSTGKDYGLPEEYADWEEVPSIDSVGVKSDYVLIEVLRYSNGPLERGEQVHKKRFVAPKPTPTLPDVGPGGVLAYTDKGGRKCRAMQFEAGKWRVYTYVGEIVVGPPPGYWHDTDLFAHANDDGFTIELGGFK